MIDHYLILQWISVPKFGHHCGYRCPGTRPSVGTVMNTKLHKFSSKIIWLWKSSRISLFMRQHNNKIPWDAGIILCMGSANGTMLHTCNVVSLAEPIHRMIPGDAMAVWELMSRVAVTTTKVSIIQEWQICSTAGEKKYRKVCNIRRTKSQNLNASRLIW